MTRKKPVFAVTLGDAIKKWCDENQVLSEDLREALDIERHMWSDILSGWRIVETRVPDIYARIYRQTGLQESDPTSIPDRETGAKRAWTLDNLISWWKKRFPEEFNKPHVQELIAQTKAAKAAGYEATYESGEEERHLIEVLTILKMVSIQDKETRALFCLQNKSIMLQILQHLQVLVQPIEKREQVLKLQEMIK